jgi:hypothetical protein
MSKQDEQFPYPWGTRPLPSPTSASTNAVERKRGAPLISENELPQKKMDLCCQLQSPKLNDLVSQCETLGCISLKLCKDVFNASAGTILHHSIRVLENLFTREEPLIFKVGFSHNPVWRWKNEIYGYVKAREKWSDMIILHYGKEPFTAAMLEAALIEKYKGIYVAICLFNFCHFIFLFLCLRWCPLP